VKYFKIDYLISNYFVNKRLDYCYIIATA